MTEVPGPMPEDALPLSPATPPTDTGTGSWQDVLTAEHELINQRLRSRVQGSDTEYI